MSIVGRILLVVVLLAVAGFCLFGFLATFESPGWLGLRIVYAVAGVLCLGGAGWVLFSKAGA